MPSAGKLQISFYDLNLPKFIMDALIEIKYQVPTPIQVKTIPHLLSGRDFIGQAQTGTGKTAAFALPLLSKIDLAKKKPQVLVLVPTRELAIQVSKAFQTYASKIRGLYVLPIYGGQEYGIQLRALYRGVHVVVGTPGRVIDHMERGTLDISEINCLVLDEADEMLRMGFIENVEWILEKTPKQRQVALFSATMPREIRQIADKYLKKPEKVVMRVKSIISETIRQRFCVISSREKFDTLNWILECENIEAVIIFVRTKTTTVEIAEKLANHGYAAVALNGDIPQKQRERTIEQFKNGKHDILVATDVAARGLDIDRLGHVINFDMPRDTNGYVHRIGRTGRAGRNGDAILFVLPHEKHILHTIEKRIMQKIVEFKMPRLDEVNKIRISRFKQKITDTIATKNLSFFKKIIEEYKLENNVSMIEIAASLAQLFHGDTSLILEKTCIHKKNKIRSNFKNKMRGILMDTYRIEVGNVHGVKPGNIVGAIANEVGIENQFIGAIDIHNDHSIIDLQKGISRKVFKHLVNVRVVGQKLKISMFNGVRRKKTTNMKNRVKMKNKFIDKKIVKKSLKRS